MVARWARERPPLRLNSLSRPFHRKLVSIPTNNSLLSVPARLGTELRSLDKIFFSIFKSYLTQDYYLLLLLFRLLHSV